jgi:ABC-type branched-subunit amino acid transport system permease subunit
MRVSKKYLAPALIATGAHTLAVCTPSVDSGSSGITLALGLGALYFLVASGLSLIYGLTGVLNFARGSFLTPGAFAGWELARRMRGESWGTLIVPLLLVTVGLALATVVLVLLGIDVRTAFTVVFAIGSLGSLAVVLLVRPPGSLGKKA